MMKLKDAISVQFTKKVSRKGKSTWQPTVGKSWLPASQTASRFLEEAHNKIASKPKTHGTIQGQMSSVSVESLLKKLLGNTSNFTTFVTQISTKSVIDEIKKTRSSSRVIMVFLHYTFDYSDNSAVPPKTVTKERLLVVMLTDSSALQFDSQGEPTETTVIDFSDVLQGALIDLDEAKSNISAQMPIDISFVKGRSDVRKYFFGIFDAEDIVTNAESSENALAAIEKLADDKGLNTAKRQKLVRAVETLLAKAKKQNNRKVTVDELDHQIFHYVGQHEQWNKDEFSKFIANRNIKVNDEFHVSAQKTKDFSMVTIESVFGEFNILKSQLNKPQSNSTDIASYDSKSKKLTVEITVSNTDAIKTLDRFS